LSGEGEGKFGFGDLLCGDLEELREVEEDFLMGMRSWRCWRETLIWRAMEMSAADLRRSSRSASSEARVMMGLVTDLEVGMGMDEGEPKEALETSLGWTSFGVVVEEVVALRLRRVAGGDWICTCLRVEDAL